MSQIASAGNASAQISRKQLTGAESLKTRKDVSSEPTRKDLKHTARLIPKTLS